MLEVLHLAYEFYTMEAIMLVMEDRPVSNYFKSKVKKYRRELHDKMAHLFRDYIVLACFGEARHALSVCDYYIPELVLNGRGIKHRVDAGLLANNYTVESIQRSLTDLFGSHWKDSSFGGTKWQRAIKSLELWGRPAVFIDHVFDLKHNGSTLFNKSDYGIVKSNYLSELYQYLNKRFEQSPEQIIQHYKGNAFGGLRRFIYRLDGQKVPKDMPENKIEGLLGYKPIEFGNTVLSMPVCKDFEVWGCRDCGTKFIRVGSEHYCHECLEKNYKDCCHECRKTYGKTHPPKETVKEVKKENQDDAITTKPERNSEVAF